MFLRPLVKVVSGIVSAACLLAGGAFAADETTSIRKLMSADQAKEWQAVGRVDLAGSGFCTGSLIAPNLVLTAAHCVFDAYSGKEMDPRLISFSAGWRQGRASAHRVARRVVVHPAYDPTSLDEFDNVGNDIALVELEHSIRNTAIMPFDRASRPAVGTTVKVVSYARDRSEMPSLEEPCEILGKSKAVFVLSCDASFGASGSPIFVMQNGIPRIASVISAKAVWNRRDVALGTSLGRPLEELMNQLNSNNGVFKSKTHTGKSLAEQLGRKPAVNFFKD